MPHPSPGHPALALRLVRAAVSLAALVLLLVGVPWVLAAAGTLPDSVPSGPDIVDTVMSPDDGHVLFTVLTLVAWALWVWFALGVLTELPHLVRRRRPSKRRRLMGAPQRLAGFLLGGLLVLPAQAAMAAPAPAIAATAPVQPAAHVGSADQGTAAGDRAVSPAPASVDGLVHVVGETGETVWDLAVEYLGSGPRAQEIRALNPHLPDTALMPAGMPVQLPADARVSQADPAADATAKSAPQVQLAASEQPISTAGDGDRDKKRTHVVKPGESLSGIAQDETGDAARWGQLYEASKNTDQPGDAPRLRDPNLIYPGQHITVPAANAPKAPNDREDAHESSGDEKDDQHKDKDNGTDNGKATDTDKEQDAGTEGGGPAGGADKPTESAKATPPPDQTADKSSPPSDRDRDTSPAKPSAPSTPADTPAPSGKREGGSSVLNTRTAGVLTSLAAAVTLALAVRRILQRRRAKPGELIAMPDEVSPAEAQMAQAAEPAGPLRLDRALRTLACRASRAGKQSPAVRGARITDSSVQILPEDLQADPAPPFTAGQGGWWVCEDTVELLEEQDAAQVDAPYPGLVTIGADEAGHPVLLNLPQAGVVLLNGGQERVQEVLTSMALELGMSPWATGTEIVVTGFGEGLNHLLPTSRIAYMRESAHTARDFAESLLEAHQEPTAARPPYLMLCAPALTADSAWQIAETLDQASGVMPAALLAPASSAGLLFEQSEIIDAASSQPQRIDILGTDITLQRLEQQAVDEITAALAVSGQDAHPAEGAWQHVPTETQTAHAAHTAAAARQPAETPDALCIPGPSAARAPAEAEAADESTPGGTAGAEELGVFPALLAASSSPASISLPTPPAAPEGLNAPAAHGKDKEEEEAEEAKSDVLPWLQLAADHSQASEPGPDAPYAPVTGAPVIQILGPVTISGVAASKHGTREAQLAALLHLKPGRSADTLCTDMDAASPWSTDTLNSRLGGLRRSLGNDENGDAYVPRRAVKSDPYQLSDKVCCDWHSFQQAVEAALPHGPAGLGQLERALDQVRGRPFGAQPLPWSQPLQQEMAMRIVHLAHTVATYRLAPGPHHDLTLARRATATGLEVDETAELLYRDWFQIEAAAGNRGGLNAAISRLEAVNRSLKLSMEIETEQLTRKLLNQTSPSLQA